MTIWRFKEWLSLRMPHAQQTKPEPNFSSFSYAKKAVLAQYLRAL